MSLAASPSDVSGACPVETYKVEGSEVVRKVRLRSGGTSVSSVTASTPPIEGDLQKTFQNAWLRSQERSETVGDELLIADIFSGSGGLSLGAYEAARAVGMTARHVLAVDTNESALAVFGDNFPEAELDNRPIDDLVDGDIGAKLSLRERRLRQRLQGLDVAIGGPPCQGHSDLNNHTRRNDPRNALYLRMVRFVEVTRPRYVVIENVPGVVRDRSRVVENAERALRGYGYSVSSGILVATEFGAAQARRRHVLLASMEQENHPSIDDIVCNFGGRRPQSIMDAIGDLVAKEGTEAYDTAAKHHKVNRERIDYLFDHDLYDLPNSQRPDCHRLKPHSYKAVYGRMRPSEPAPTITSGFGSTGQGRFVHPVERRTLTPHEAARLQGFPDWFRFENAPTRTALQEIIGNAVPSQLGYAAIVSLIR